MTNEEIRLHAQKAAAIEALVHATSDLRDIGSQLLDLQHMLEDDPGTVMPMDLAKVLADVDAALDRVRAHWWEWSGETIPPE